MIQFNDNVKVQFYELTDEERYLKRKAAKKCSKYKKKYKSNMELVWKELMYYKEHPLKIKFYKLPKIYAVNDSNTYGILIDRMEID